MKAFFVFIYLIFILLAKGFVIFLGFVLFFGGIYFMAKINIFGFIATLLGIIIIWFYFRFLS